MKILKGLSESGILILPA